MFNQTKLYELSFVAPSKKGVQKPQLVFAIQQAHVEEIARRLDILAQRNQEHAHTYAGAEVAYYPIQQDLFGQIEFGYARCGYLTQKDTEVSLRLELDRAKLTSLALTIQLLNQALLIPIEERPSNQPQQLDLQVYCDRADCYGHAVGGYLSQSVVEWLRRYHSTQPHGYLEWALLPPAVTRAMKAAWVSVCAPDTKRYARDCSGYVCPDGRFILNCFGNACDIAIYPEDLSMSKYLGSTRFGCHNLDRADQQITLLAGLAKLCELARKDG